MLLGTFAFASYGQSPETLTNQMIYKMVQAGVPASIIIQTIAAAPKVDFHFLPSDLQAFESYKVPENVFSAMAAKAEGLLTPAVQARSPGSPAQQAESLPTPAVQAPSPRSPAQPTAPRSESGERYLGHVQLGGFAGADLGPDRGPLGVASFSVGAEVRVGIAKYFDISGTYAFDKIGNIGPISAYEQEFMGGVRVPFRNRGRVTPYLQTSAGGLNLSAKAFGVGVGINKFAVAPGGGLDFAVARHLNVGIDLRAIKALDIPGGLAWQYRATGGLFVGF